MVIKELQVSSCLVKSKLPGTDYVINPYVGCAFGCVYCYASFMGRFVGETIGNWGNYVYAKANIIVLLEKELQSWAEEKRHSTILLSSVTDPYQGAEAKYKLTRGILSVLAREKYPGLVSILTKSPLVLRDIDVLKQLPQVEVGMTVTTAEDEVGKQMEVRAPLSTARINALQKLNEQGMKTYAFVGPLFPHFRYKPELLDKLFQALATAGVKDVFVEHINLKRYIREHLISLLKKELPNAEEMYAEAATEEHKQALELFITEKMAAYNLRLIMNKVLDHNAI